MTENEEFVKERKTLERKKKIVEIFFFRTAIFSSPRQKLVKLVRQR